MTWLRKLLRGWNPRLDDDIQRELQSHLDLEAEEQRADGIPGRNAGAAARRALGNELLVREDVRAVWRWNVIESLVQDIRYGMRLMARSPLFTLFTVASLALGIGATSAIFTLFHAIVLQELPVREPERLVVASFATTGRSPNYSMPFPQFEAMQKRSTTMESLFAINPMGRVSVAYQGQVELAQGLFATGAYHPALGLKATLGRLLNEQDDHAGTQAAVLSHAYWLRRFGGNPAALGATLLINQTPFTVVGVEPREYDGIEVGRASDVTVPMRARDTLSDSEPLWDQAFATWIYIMGRLKPGVPMERARQELSGILQQVSFDAAKNPIEQRLARGSLLRLESGAGGAHSGLRFKYERWLRLLLGVLGLVLLLASLNVATLLLARSEARHKEISTRLALGARRGRLVRQLLTESMLIALAGGVLGFAASRWGSKFLLRIATAGADRLPVDATPGASAAVFALGTALLTCLLFGLAPALRSTSRRRMNIGREVGAGRQRKLFDRALVAAQVALSLTLLVSAGLFVRSLEKLWSQDTGYDRSQVLMFSVDAKLAGKRGMEVLETYQRVLEELRTIPGAKTVSMSAVRPVSDNYYMVSSVSRVADRVLPGDQRIRIAANNIGPGYFATLGIPLVAGRDFTDSDRMNAPHVAIISQRMASHFEGNPIGQRIEMNKDDFYEVVGVAKDTRYANLKDAPRDVVYTPLMQRNPKSMWYTPTLEIRYAGSAEETLRAAREALRRVDSGLEIISAKTLIAQTEESLSRERLLALISSFSGGFALLLACIGLYGLMTYAVTRRTSELGLRMALGARPGTLLRMVLRDSALTVLAGIVMGLGGSVAMGRVIRTQLYGVEIWDVWAFATAVAALGLLAFVAAYLPARRASLIDPMTALRCE